MKIVVATPLYPPDIAQPAPYIKELAKRLVAHTPSDAITIVTYGHLPEQIPGVRIVAVSKRQPLPLRLVAFIFALLKEARSADILYIENGASVELPAVIVSLLCRAPLIFHTGDAAAHAHATHGGIYGAIERLVMTRASSVVTDTPIARPEILPFVPYPPEAFVAYERSWEEHRAQLDSIFSHA